MYMNEIFLIGDEITADPSYRGKDYKDVVVGYFEHDRLLTLKGGNVLKSKVRKTGKTYKEIQKVLDKIGG